MALRGKKPEAIQKRLKMLSYGAAGTGKTMAAIAFPKPYVIDAEKGCENEDYVKILTKSDSLILQTSDFSELLDEVKELLTTKHEFKTLIIDPLTIFYDNLVERTTERLRLATLAKNPNSNATGTENGRHYLIANNKMKHLFNLILRLDMNVIVTTHSKKELAPDLTVLGTTFDCYKKLDYLFDIVFEVQKRGKERIAIVKKTRMMSKFSDGDQFPFSYDAIAEKYGREILEKESIPEKLATDEQILTIKKLIEETKTSPLVYQNWLDRSRSENFSEMNTVHIAKCIQLLEKKLQTILDEEAKKLEQEVIS